MYLTKKTTWKEPINNLVYTGATGFLKNGKSDDSVVLELKFDEFLIDEIDVAYGLDTLSLVMIPDPEGIKISSKGKWTITVVDKHALPLDMLHALESVDKLPIAGKLNKKSQKIQIIW